MVKYNVVLLNEERMKIEAKKKNNKADFAHDLKNRLTVMKFQIDLLDKEEWKSASPKVKKLLKSLSAEVDKIVKLSNSS